MNEDSRSSWVVWRLLAVLGFAVEIVAAILGSLEFPDRAEVGLFVAIVVAATTFGFTGIVLRNGARRLASNVDLVLPFGVLLLAERVIAWISAAPAIGGLLSETWVGNVAGLTISLSLGFALSIFASVFFQAWMTTAILRRFEDVSRRAEVDAAAGWRRWGATFVIAFVGCAPLIASLAIGIVFAQISIEFFVGAIGLFALAWNVGTAALLLLGLSEESLTASGLFRAFRLSWAHAGRWIVPVVGQLLIAGIFVFVHVEFSTQEGTAFHHRTETNTNVESFWIGGYRDSTEWYADYVSTVESTPIPIVVFSLRMLLLILAIVVKLHLVERMLELGLLRGSADRGAARDRPESA